MKTKVHIKNHKSIIYLQFKKLISFLNLASLRKKQMYIKHGQGQKTMTGINFQQVSNFILLIPAHHQLGESLQQAKSHNGRK